MSDYELEMLALWRANLPQYPGETVPEQLHTAWKDAEQRLGRYVGEFRYSEAEARAVLHEIGALLDAHRSEYVALMRDPQTDDLPEALQMKLGADKAKQFLIAMYSEAARGLGPWLGGLIGKELSDGQLAEWRARQDAQDRLVVFAGIRKLDEEGSLDELFRAQATSGLGVAPAVVAIVAGAVIWTVVGLALISWFFQYRLESQRLKQANEDHKKRCDKADQLAQKPGPDQEFWKGVVLRCHEANQNILQEKPEVPWEGLLDKVVIAAVVVGVVYVGATVLAPSIGQGIAERGRARAPT